MSSEWPLVRLADHVESCLGKMLDAKKNKGALQPYLGNSNVRWGKFDISDLAEMKFEAHEDERYSLRPGDLVVCEGGEPGRCAIWNGPTGIKIQKALHRIRSKETLDNYYLFYWFCLVARTGYLEPHFTGSTIKHLTGKAIAALEVPLPPVVTQRAMVDVLRSLDDRITLLRETNATLEAIAQALFKSWFVNFDPVRAKAEGLEPEGMDAATAALFPDSFEESELGFLPKGWEVRPVGELVEGVYDGPHATPAESESGPIFLGIKNLTGTRLELTDIRHISEDDWAKWTRRVEPTHGDIVFSYEATLGFFAVIPPEVRCCLGRRLALIRPHSESGAGLFWFHQFISTPFQQMLDKHTIQGATVNRIALKAFPSYLVLNPSETLKLAFNDVVEPLWATIHSNQAQVKTLTQLRDTLLPRLISGQLRLPEVEATVENCLSEAV